MEDGQAQAAPESGSASQILSGEQPSAQAQPQSESQIKVTPDSESVKSDLNQSWFDSLNDSHKEYVSKKGFKDSEAVLESYINLEKLRGVPEDRLLKLPDQKDDPRWGDIFQKLGRPDSPKGYELPVADDEQGKAFGEWARENFFELNLTNEQAQGVIERLGQYIEGRNNESIEQYNQKYQEQDLSLKKEWGAAYHQNIAQAQRAAQEFEIPGEAIDALEKTLGFDGVMKFMHSLSQRVGESKYIDGGSAMNPSAKLTPDQAKSRIEALKADGAFVQKYLGGDMEAREEMARLHKFANPES